MSISDQMKAALNQAVKTPQVPEKSIPVPGDPLRMWVVYIWGDKQLVGSPAVPMPAMVTSYNPETGRASGWAYTDPSMVVQTPKGPGRLPPLMPMVGAPYCGDKPAKETWMVTEDFQELMRKAQEPKG